MSDQAQFLASALWRIYRRPERPTPWAEGGNLPWNDPAFSKRMLREHLDESHGAASRVTKERNLVIEWLWPRLGLGGGSRLLDVTCGPGLYAVELAHRGCEVTGVDFSPAAVAYARELATHQQVADRCTFIEQDVRQTAYGKAEFDAALFIYGQLAVFTREEAQELLGQIARALRPGGKLAVELLNSERIDRKDSTWWYTASAGLWGDEPYLHLGERTWHEEEEISVERFHILHLDSGQLTEVTLCDQAYDVQEMSAMMKTAGFSSVDIYPNWDGLGLYDSGEWIVYLAEK